MKGAEGAAQWEKLAPPWLHSSLVFLDNLPWSLAWWRRGFCGAGQGGGPCDPEAAKGPLFSEAGGEQPLKTLLVISSLVGPHRQTAAVSLPHPGGPSDLVHPEFLWGEAVTAGPGGEGVSFKLLRKPRAPWGGGLPWAPWQGFRGRGCTQNYSSQRAVREYKSSKANKRAAGEPDKRAGRAAAGRDRGAGLPPSSGLLRRGGCGKAPSGGPAATARPFFAAGGEMAGGRLAQVPVVFEDVAVYFTPEEWAELSEWQRELYQDVMVENYELVSSLECLLSIPALLSRLAQREAQYAAGNSSSPVNGAPSPKREMRGSPALPDMPRCLLRGTLSRHSRTAGKRRKRTRSQGRRRPTEAGRTSGDTEKTQRGRKREKPYKCPRCQRSFRSRLALTAHRRLHMQKWPRLSLQSGAHSSTTPDVAVPQEGPLGSSSGHVPGPGPQEEGTLPFWPEMALHQQAPAAHSFNPWALGYGPQPLPGPQAPGLHGSGEFICDQCGWSFHGWEELVTHQLVHMAAEGIAGSVPKAGALAQLASDRPYACTQCGKSFRHKPNLLAHRQVHTGERRYQCPECGKSFGSKAYLASHQHIHTGEKPYVCGQCGKSFRHKPNLLSHQKIHTRDPFPQSHPLDSLNGEHFPAPRPVADSLGTEAFQAHRPPLGTQVPCFPNDTLVPQPPSSLPANSQPLLAIDRPFVCPVCAKQFRCKPYLVAHIRIHTGEKPYACSRCPKRFSQKSNLVSHERLHTGEKPYACPLCPRVFSQGSNMRAHQRSHRNVSTTTHEADGRLLQGYSARQVQPPD
ncbi:replication initiator 1-like [Sphaerodactylus townsendi]|uniref:replication initiator 1-like n=1 Tax=Sphaerodactylus townsendi TaxID=933632 RepID=UPI0020273B9C|nr:replication initiator 1-like [Sphaerodactylus townsendi]